MQASQPTTDPGYAAGACNIGADEIARRRRAGHIGLGTAVILLVVLVAVQAPPLARLLVALPVALAAVGYLQAHYRFCAAYGFLGVFNFGPLGRPQRVVDRASTARDRAKAVRITAASGLIGLAVGVVLVILPT